MSRSGLRLGVNIDALALTHGYAVIRCRFKNKLQIGAALDWIDSNLTPLGG